MTFIANLDEKEYEAYVSAHSKSHFLQSYYWGEVAKHKNFKPYYVGLKNSDQLVATALILEKTKNHLKYMYIPRGFIIDYSDKKLLAAFTKELKKFAKQKKAFFIKIDPDIKLRNLDIDGHILPDFDNFKLVNDLKSLGYIHQGFNKNFEGNQPRYTFRLDVTGEIDDIVKNYHMTTRNIINRKNSNNLNIYKSEKEEDIKGFHDVLMNTADRNDVKFLGLDYYKNFYKILHKHNMSDLYIAKINVAELLQTYAKKKFDLEKQIRELDYDQKRNKDKKEVLKKEVLVQLQKLAKDVDNAKKIKQKELILSAAITTKYKDKVWTVHAGNSDLLRELGANYLIFHEIIKDAHEEGYSIVDFFGTTGDPENSEVKGIHLFKKRFGGEYTEFIGEFDLVINKLLYYLYIKLSPILRRK